MKAFTTRKGRQAGNAPFTRTTLHNLLTNPIYIGRVRHGGETYPGEHSRIVSDAPATKAFNIRRTVPSVTMLLTADYTLGIHIFNVTLVKPPPISVSETKFVTVQVIQKGG